MVEVYSIRQYVIHIGDKPDVSPSRNRDDAFLLQLRVRPVFQRPGEAVQLCPECQIQPSLNRQGDWSLPYRGSGVLVVD